MASFVSALQMRPSQQSRPSAYQQRRPSRYQRSIQAQWRRVEATVLYFMAAVEGQLVDLMASIEGRVLDFMATVEGRVVNMMASVEGTLLDLMATVEGTVENMWDQAAEQALAIYNTTDQIRRDVTSLCARVCRGDLWCRATPRLEEEQAMQPLSESHIINLSGGPVLSADLVVDKVQEMLG